MMSIICLIGADGVGKTTYAKWLVSFLRARGRSAIYVHVLSSRKHVISLLKLNALGYRLIRRSMSETLIIHPKKHRIINFMRLLLRLAIEVLYSWTIYIIYKYVIYREKIIVFDRYFYDIIISICRLHRKYTSLILSLVPIIPRPGLILLLEADLKTLAKRRREQNIHELAEYVRLYKILRKRLTNVIHINTDVNSSYVKHLLKIIISRYF